MSIDKNKVPGVKVIPAHQQFLISSGTKIINELVHQESGVPVGTIFLVREFGGSLQYSSLLLKYFISQGIHDDHQVFLADPCDAEKTFRTIPSFTDSLPENQVKNEPTESQDLLIAWRYKNLPSKDPPKSSGPITFDVKTSIPKETLEGRTFSFIPPSQGSDSVYISLLKEIYNVLNDPSSPYKFTSSKEDERPISVLRIVINDFGSLLYGSKDSEDLKRFIISLKSLCRNYLCVVGMQIKGRDETLFESIKDHIDSVIDVRAFEEDSAYKKLFKKYHGLMQLERSDNLHRLHLNPKINSVYLFKSLRNGFAMELMSLPPDLDVQNSNESSKNNALSCQSIDF
ncbi:elongator complex protein 4 [Lepeophtheirus salmonis]|uniref:Elongator complex protein 4 n=1 Tax=Lepeophtheirus salmonis TaxID=72036 RepID=A0A0K2UF44_LEPSM|nr:elongator complex protein 4-like [Lepeophtheirus salmonis]